MKNYLAFLAVVQLFLSCLANAQDATSNQAAAGSVVASQELADYVKAPDDAYRWEVRQEMTVNNCEVLRLHLSSQTWKNTEWKHVLYLIKPANVDPKRSDAVLLIGGGRWHSEWPANGPATVSVRSEAQLMSGVANQFGCVIAVLTQVPFQPMFGDKYEDEIIAATFAKFIETQDPSWPLLLPMVKSAVRGMDATTACAQENWGLTLDQFTVTGASKRGWTTWLTGAVDPRATAIAPMVIDMLNMREQMTHQLDTWGKYSEQIADYTELELPKYLGTPRGQKLQCIVDPFAYRKDLTQPKLLIFGTNDRYWPLDACNQYWNQLAGQKYLLYVPNQGHGIDDYPRVIGSLSALHRSRHGGAELPKLDWKFSEADDEIALDVDASGEIDSVRGWVAHSSTKDFREVKWREVGTKKQLGGTWQCVVERPDSGYVACFGEVVSVADSLPAFFSTNVQVFSAE